MESSGLTVERPSLLARRRSYSFDSAELELKRLSKSGNLEISALQSLATRLFLLEDQVNPHSSVFYQQNEEEVNRTEKSDLEKLTKCSEEVIASVLLEYLSGKVYDESICSQQTAAISKKVEQQMKGKVLKDKQKVLALAFIGEVRNQGIQVTSQCLWDPLSDFMASASLCVNNLFAVCYVFVVQ